MQIAGGWLGVALGLSASGCLALGASWTEVDSSLPRSPVGVRTVVIDPSSPSTIYALEFSAPRSFGHGSLFKSTDGGGTWNLAGELSSVTALVIDPGDSSKLFAVAHGTVVKSLDGGQSWSITGLGQSSASALAMDPQNTSTLYAVSGRAVFKTTDGGASWSPKTTGLPASWQSDGNLTIAATVPSTIFLNAGDGLYKSADGGESWRGLTVGQGARTIGPEALDPAHPSTVYTVVVTRIPQPWQDEDLYFSTLFKSTDAGETWNGTNTATPGVLTSLAADPTSTIYASNVLNPYYENETDAVVKSTDGGASWGPVSTGLPSPIPGIFSLALNPANPSALFAGYFDASTGRGGVFRTLDGGAGWNNASSGLAIFAVHALAIDATNRATVYVAAGDGVSSSINSGVDWSTVHFAASGPGGAWVPSLLIDPNDPKVVYASAGSSDGCNVMEHFLRKSTDGGATWSDLAVQQCDSGAVSLAMAPSDSNTLYAAPEYPAGGTFLYQTGDGGANWNGTYIDAPVTALVIDPANPATLYGGTAYGAKAQGPRGVIKSSDGGKTWASTALTGVDVSVLALDPGNSSILYAGTSVPSPDGTPGALKTTDGGVTWFAINSGLDGIISSRTPITALALDPTLSVLYLGTSGGGVFKSIDGGANWTPFNDGLPSLDIRALAVSSDGSGTVYAGTPGGVFRAGDKQ